MVILRGIVRSGRDSTEENNVPIAGAAIIQLSSVVYTSSNGTFYTSALTLDTAICSASEHRTVDYSIPDFATTYDPAGVISGSLTSVIDTTSVSGQTLMPDNNKIFMSGALVGRILEMRSGIDDSVTAVVEGNTQNIIYLGAGSTPGGWT